jgi:predicted Zn-dependent peptidase
MGTRALWLAALVVASATRVLAQEAIPEHPRDLKYPELRFAPPKAADHRIVLANGLRVYLVPDRTVPALHVEAFFDAGELWLPKEKRGLAKLAGKLLREGGVEGLEARALDRKLDEIAAAIDTEIGLDRGSASLWTLSRHTDLALDLFARVLTKPVFADDRIRRAKAELKQEVAHRDDEPDAQLDHLVAVTVHGADHPLALRESAATVDAVTRDDLVGFHKRYVSPKATILAVAGDFERDAMVKRLEALFKGWNAPWQPDPLPARAPAERRPGVFLLDRELNQGFVEIARPGIAIGDADEIPLQVMNYILGGGSFTSRITQRVRTDEGLAYSAGSYVRPGRKLPGLIALYYQSKAESTAFAAKICMEEAKRIRETPVSKEEIERARSAMRDRFPERFRTAHGAAAALAQAELDGRPLDHFEKYTAAVEAMTEKDVQRVAQAYLAPEAFSVVVIGPKAVVTARDEAHAAALADLGKVADLKAED